MDPLSQGAFGAIFAQTISNKNSVSFYNCEIPLIISLMFDSLFKNKNSKLKVISNFIMLVKNQFNDSEIKLFLENKSENKILINFAKSISQSNSSFIT